jgi:lysophospholipase L1-like esterase
MNVRRIKFIFWAATILSAITACKPLVPKPIYAINLPLLENFVPDGNPDEWRNTESYRLWADPIGGYTDTADLIAYMKAARNQNCLLLMLDVSDESYLVDTLNPWNGDAIEVFLSQDRCSGDILQISIIPSLENDFVKIDDHSKEKVFAEYSGEIKSFTRIQGKKRITEVEIGLLPKAFGGGIVNSLALQVYVNDADSGSLDKHQLVWFPIGQSYNSSSSMFKINLSDEKQIIPDGASRLVITDNEKLNLYVFGAKEGDVVGIYRNGKFLSTYKSNSKSQGLPDTFDISNLGWDIENDSLFVTLNGESLCFHQLFLAPRLYEKLEKRRFEQDIRNFLYKDRQSFPPENATLFIGSSSIVRWESLEKDFPELQIIQRGFGGSTSPDALMYINQIVLPYKPSKIVYYEGDNDIPMGLSSEEIRDNIRAFIGQVTSSLPKIRIYILSPKPSINRMFLWEKYQKTHLLLKALANEYNNVEYVDVATPMFDQNGKLNYSLFVEDGIHMNQNGYSIWTKVLRKALELD